MDCPQLGYAGLRMEMMARYKPRLEESQRESEREKEKKSFRQQLHCQISDEESRNRIGKQGDTVFKLS